MRIVRQFFAILASPTRVAAVAAAFCAFSTTQTPLAAAQTAETVQTATGERLGRVTGRPLPRYESLRAGVVNLRRGPGEDHRILWTITRRGLPVRVIAEYRVWRRVELHTGEQGWVWRNLLSPRRTAIVLSEGATLRLSPEDGARLVARVAPVTPLRVMGCAAAWCRLERGGVAGWAPKSSIWGVEADERF